MIMYVIALLVKQLIEENEIKKKEKETHKTQTQFASFLYRRVYKIITVKSFGTISATNI